MQRVPPALIILGERLDDQNGPEVSRRLLEGSRLCRSFIVGNEIWMVRQPPPCSMH